MYFKKKFEAAEVSIRKAAGIIAEKLVGTTDEPYEIDKIKSYMDKNGWRWFFNEHSRYFEFTKGGKELSGSLVPWCAYVLTKDGKYYVGRSLKDWKKDLKALGIMESAGEAKVSFTENRDAGLKAANAVRDFLATYLRNELGGPESSLAIRSYDDAYPMVDVVDKNDPGRMAHLEIGVYSPAGDGNFKIVYKGRNISDGRIDCPEDAEGLEKIARMLAEIVSRRKGEAVEEKLEYEKGHKNSKGEDAPWVIRSHTDGRVLASFTKKADAEKHLARMKSYADKT